MGKNSKQRRQATVDELSWAREYMDLFVPCNNGYNVIISKKGSRRRNLLVNLQTLTG